MSTSKLNILKVVVLGLLIVTACTANAIPAGPFPTPPSFIPAGPFPTPPSSIPAGPFPTPPAFIPAGPFPTPPVVS